MSSSLARHALMPEPESVKYLLRHLAWSEEQAESTRLKAAQWIKDLRSNSQNQKNDMESFFRTYGLDSEEGIALMSMAEALLRIPDIYTANALIKDKVAAINWLKSSARNDDMMKKFASLGLNLTGATMNSLFSKLGEPVIRNAMMQAMKVMGRQFVMGQTIESASKLALTEEFQPYRMSFDMLGEGARTEEDAQRYCASYAHAMDYMADKASAFSKAPGLSVKLSALHPRYHYSHAEHCVPLLVQRLGDLCETARKANLTLTVDAEETERLELSFLVIEKVLDRLGQDEWVGFGIAVQAYHKRALAVIDHIVQLAQKHNRRIQVRLVKGAYWDTEIKQAQLLGLADYPVFTRKTHTDVSYLSCACKMLNYDRFIYSMFGTHNVHTVLAVQEMAGPKSYEYQKLFGMGNALYRKILEGQSASVSVYAPVGLHQDLLPYLVRRLLENGANSSFVKQIFDPKIAPVDLAEDPIQRVKIDPIEGHSNIPLPPDIYASGRKNARGFDLNHSETLGSLLFSMNRKAPQNANAFSIVGGKDVKKGISQNIFDPANITKQLGKAIFANEDSVDQAFANAMEVQHSWSSTNAEKRADILLKYADLLERDMDELMMVCVREAGKTLVDSRDEVREAIDFCRYYAQEGQKLFDDNGLELQGPTGESNIYKREGRGIFVCISPWNFPLAIFTGQIAAALMAGNCVIAKPAQQTNLIAYKAVKLWFEAGLPKQVLSLLLGDGRLGAQIVQHQNVSGVAFTGSTLTAKSIHRALAEKEGPITPLIAETGGQNVMIADSSALTEQLVDDVIVSAFGSAGQRCSAARILAVQEDSADAVIKMLSGALQELRVGDPFDPSSDLGPVIDETAYAALSRHLSKLDGFGKKLGQAYVDTVTLKKGHFFAPCLYEIQSLDHLEKEVFGPILHLYRYDIKDLDRLINQINSLGYGLTLGIHSRIENRVRWITERVNVGNIYVNRSMTGAVVGVQPFGGKGLSGTGPKAGGPDYLLAFSSEKHVSTDLTAAGGNASLVMLSE